MPRELIEIQVGQCGNQVGTGFWKRLCEEHGIAPDGKEQNPGEHVNFERKSVLFNESSDHRWLPRSVMIDMEPGVINGIRNSDHGSLFHPENTFVHPEGGGAGNNWAKGYAMAAEHETQVADAIMDMIIHEADQSDSLEGFILCHSIAGGTGSGMGSYLLERIHDYFPRKVLQTYSVFPNLKNGSDVVVQPYNSVLTLKRLAEQTDAVVVLDNTALDHIVVDKLAVEDPTFEDTNALVSSVMSASTATLRFPSHSNSDLSTLISTLNPVPYCKFLSTCFEPLYLEKQTVPANQKVSVAGILRRLVHPNNWMVTVNPSYGKFVSIAHLLQGDLNIYDVHNSMKRIFDRKTVDWIPGSYNSYTVTIAKKSPYLENKAPITGLSLANHTGVRRLMSHILSQFDQLWKRKAFINTFESNLTNESEFEESRATVDQLIYEYKQLDQAGLFDMNRTN